MKELTMKDMKPGETGKILRLESPEKGKLMALGIIPGTSFKILRNRPSLIVRLGFTEVALDIQIAEKIIAEKIYTKYQF